MKKKHGLIVLLVILFALPVFAQKTTTPETTVSTISLTSFHKLVVNTAIDIVLVQDDAVKQAVVEGDASSIAGITVFIAKETMTVSGKNISGNAKIKLTIPVNHLSWIEINGDASITSANALSSPKLTVYINADCAVNLRSAGKIAVTGADGHEVRYTRNVQKANTESLVAELLK